METWTKSFCGCLLNSFWAHTQRDVFSRRPPLRRFSPPFRSLGRVAGSFSSSVLQVPITTSPMSPPAAAPPRAASRGENVDEGSSFCQVETIFLRFDSPFSSPIVLFQHNLFSRSLARFWTIWLWVPSKNLEKQTLSGLFLSLFGKPDGSIWLWLSKPFWGTILG